MSLRARSADSAAATERGRRFSGMLCVVLLTLFTYGVWRLTHGLTIWTFDDWRQEQIVEGSLQAQAVSVRGPSPSWLWSPTRADAGGQVYLVDFVYTRCPTVCRALGSEFQQMQTALRESAAPEAKRVRLVSMSFDVSRDDVHALKQFAAQMHAEPRWWQLGVPASQADADALLRSLGVVVIPDGEDGFVHNGAIHVLDAQGRLRGLYEPGQWRQALDAAYRWAGRPAGAPL